MSPERVPDPTRGVHPPIVVRLPPLWHLLYRYQPALGRLTGPLANAFLVISTYINHRVAQLLNKLLIELTKSRARQSNDNAPVESKNGAIVRKHLGYAHITFPSAGHR